MVTRNGFSVSLIRVGVRWRMGGLTSLAESMTSHVPGGYSSYLLYSSSSGYSHPIISTLMLQRKQDNQERVQLAWLFGSLDTYKKSPRSKV